MEFTYTPDAFTASEATYDVTDATSASEATYSSEYSD